MKPCYVRVGVLLGLVVLVVGCGRGPKLVPVTGSVKLDGKPLADASVYFRFTDYPRPAVGGTDESGNFTLSYLNRKGAPIGSCTIVIRKQGKVAGEEGQRELIPGRYNSNSQQKYEVTKSGPNEFNLELSSEADPSDSPSGAQPQQAAPTYEESEDGEVDDTPRKAQPGRPNPTPKNDESDDGGDGE